MKDSKKSIIYIVVAAIVLALILASGIYFWKVKTDNDKALLEKKRVEDLIQKYPAAKQSQTVIFESYTDGVLNVTSNGVRGGIPISDDVTYYVGEDFQKGDLNNLKQGTLLNLYDDQGMRRVIRSGFTKEVQDGS